MLLKTEAIVVRTIKYRDTSVISTILTPDKGMISVIASGVRKSKSRMHASLFQPPSLIEIVLYYKDQSELHRVREARPSVPLMSIYEELKKIAVAQFMAELVKNCVREISPNPSVFNFVKSHILALEDSQPPDPNTPLLFLLGLASKLGISPELNKKNGRFLDLREGVLSPSPPPHPHFLDEEKTAVAKILIKGNNADITALKLNNEVRRILFKNFIDYFLIHIDGMKPLKSPDIFRMVLLK